MDRLGSRVTWLGLVLTNTWWDPILGVICLSCIVVRVHARGHVYLHDVTNIAFSLSISIFHGVHESLYIFLICCIWWQQLEFIVHFFMGILLIWIISFFWFDYFMRWWGFFQNFYWMIYSYCGWIFSFCFEFSFLLGWRVIKGLVFIIRISLLLYHI